MDGHLPDLFGSFCTFLGAEAAACCVEGAGRETEKTLPFGVLFPLFLDVAMGHNRWLHFGVDEHPLCPLECSV